MRQPTTVALLERIITPESNAVRSAPELRIVRPRTSTFVAAMVNAVPVLPASSTGEFVPSRRTDFATVTCSENVFGPTSTSVSPSRARVSAEETVSVTTIVALDAFVTAHARSAKTSRNATRGAHAPSRVPTDALVGRREAWSEADTPELANALRCSARARNTAREGACAPLSEVDVRRSLTTLPVKVRDCHRARSGR